MPFPPPSRRRPTRSPMRSLAIPVPHPAAGPLGLALAVAVAVAVALAILSGPALAGRSHTVTQAGKAFRPAALEVARGDTVTFANDDGVAHNVYAKGGEKDFSTGAIKPGESRDVTFEAPGTVEARCAIHPLMKMSVTVK